MIDIILGYRPIIAVFISQIAALLIIASGERIKQNARESFTIVASIVKALCVFSMLPCVLNGENFDITLIRIADGIDLGFKVDSFGMVFACIASGLWIITSIYSIGYMRGGKEQGQTGYFAAFCMCLSGTIGICFARNLLTFFIFYEMLTVATYPLVVHHKDLEARTSGRTYLIYTLVSGQMMLAGIIYIYYKCGTTEFAPGGFIESEITGKTATFIFILMILAGAVKAGVIPLHSWLPQAMVAPTPVSALLHAVAVVKAGAFCVGRIVLYTFGPHLARQCGGSKLLAVAAGITIIASSLIALKKTNLKERLAYSTIGQLSYIVLGFCLLNPQGIIGGMYHMVAHALLKISLFFCAGAIFINTGKKDINEMRGVGRKMPVTMGCFAVASLGIAGLPFLPAFFSKLNIMQGSLTASMPIFIIVLVISALLSLTYLMPVAYIAFTKKDVSPEFTSINPSIKTDASLMMLVPIVIAILLSFIIGIYPDFGAKILSLAKMTAYDIFQ